MFLFVKHKLKCLSINIHTISINSQQCNKKVYKGVPKLTQDFNLIENTVFSLDYVIFLLNYKVHGIGLFVE